VTEYASLATPTNQNGTDRFDGLETIYTQVIPNWTLSLWTDITVIPTNDAQRHEHDSNLSLFILDILLTF
jgi:hypothetical protein